MRSTVPPSKGNGHRQHLGKRSRHSAELIVLKERIVKGMIAYRDVFPALMELMKRGYFPAEKPVTKRMKLDEIATEGFETLMNEKDQVKFWSNPNAFQWARGD